MKLTSLKQDLVTATYEHGGEKLTLQIDRNVVTPAFLREIASRLRPLTLPQLNGDGDMGAPYEGTATLLEQQAELSISLLAGGLIKSWDLTEDDGQTMVPITEETLRELPALLLQDLWVFAMEEAQGVKKLTSATSGGGT